MKIKLKILKMFLAAIVFIPNWGHADDPYPPLYGSQPQTQPGCGNATACSPTPGDDCVPCSECANQGAGGSGPRRGRPLGSPVHGGGHSGAIGSPSAGDNVIHALSGPNPFHAFTGDVMREVRDLEVWGGVGEHGLAWERIGHSRMNSGQKWFGQAQGWRHSYQWELVDSGWGRLTLYYPSGTVFNYTSSNNQWVGAASNPDALSQNGNTFTLKRANGWQYHFERLTDSNGTYYQLQDFKDSQQNVYTLTYDSHRRLIKVTEPAGRYLQIGYQDIDINQTAFQDNRAAEFKTLAQINSTPASGQWTEIAVSDTTAYRYLRYYTGGEGTTDSYSNIAEMEFYDENNVKLTGVAFGTDPSWGNNPNTTFDKASDGDTSTFFDYVNAHDGYTGIDLGAGNAKRISKVRFYPRDGFNYRMNGGMFQGSNTSSVPQTVTLAQVNSTPASGQWTEIAVSDTKAYRYLRYYTGGDETNNTWSNIAEMEFYDENNVKITGTAFGTNPSWGNNANTTFDKATDGDTSTFFDYAYPHFGFTGIDLGAGNAKRVTKVRFYPRDGFNYRMNGGMFQGSNAAPLTRTVIAQVTTSDGRSVSYDYGTMHDTLLNADWLVLNHAGYGDNTQAAYNYIMQWPGQRPLMVEASDPRTPGNAVHMKYEYWVNSWVYGAIYAERDGEHAQIVAKLEGNGNWWENTDKVTYANGAVRTFVDNGTGNVVQATDGLGRVRNSQYGQNNAGFLLQTQDALGRITSYTRSTAGNPLTMTYPDNSVTSWTRDDLDLMLTSTDQLGRVTTLTRDANHRVTRIDYPNSSYETFTYNSFGEVLTHRLRNGGTESYGYDARGLNTSSADSLNNVTTYTYDALDRLASMTDARNNTTSYAYNERGLMTTKNNSDNSTVSFAYDSFGNRTGMTNEIGKTWTTTYDEFSRVTSKIDPLSRTTQISYALPGGGGCSACASENKPTQITLPSGKQTTIAYDLEWQKTSQTAGANSADAATTSYGYDLVGNRTSMTDPRGKVWAYTYDNRDRINAATDPLNHTTQWAYDAISNNLTETRADNGVTTDVYDAMNRLTQSTDPKNQVTQYGYDSADNLLTLTDANNHAYSYTYDLLNRKLTMKYPDNTQEGWSYDAVSNVAIFHTRAGQVRSYTYDSRNRETASVWSDSTPAISRTYDAASRLLTMSSSVSALTYTYDNANQMLSESQAIAAAGGAKTVSYAYDADGNRGGVTYPDATAITYGYTNRNQLASVNSVASVVQYQYDLNGNSLSKSLANNTSTSYVYDDANRLMVIDHQKNSVSFAKFEYNYNIVNDRATKTQTDVGSPVHSENYTYDAIDQVVGATYADNMVVNRAVNYGLDAVGNRTSVTDNNVATNYTANNLNQYTAVGTDSPTYNVNGNLTAQNGWTYSFDAMNRLTSASSVNSVIQFSYDPRNRRVSQTINGTTTFFYFDGWSLIEERNGTDVQQARYVNGVGIDEILCRAMPTATTYYHGDALGSTTHLTDASGNVAEKYTYDIFGTPTILTPQGLSLAASAFGNRFLFTGREWIAEIALYDYRNRFYSQALGRFLQTDPLGFFAADVNFYRYVTNCPTRFIDSNGLDQITAPGQPPPVPVPGGDPGNGWKWNPDPTNSRGGSWGPASPIPGQSQPSGSFEPGNPGHWDVDDGKGNRQRYDPNGKPITPDEAHGKKCPPQIDNAFMRRMSEVTGLSGAALLAYIFVSEGSRFFPPRNLIPVP